MEWKARDSNQKQDIDPNAPDYSKAASPRYEIKQYPPVGQIERRLVYRGNGAQDEVAA